MNDLTTRLGTLPPTNDDEATVGLYKKKFASPLSTFINNSTGQTQNKTLLMKIASQLQKSGMLSAAIRQ